MNASLASLTLVAAITTPAGLAAGEIFDSPGPGYRQQIELVSPIRDRASAPVLISDFRIQSSGTAQPFSQPIRLFDRTPQPPTTLPLAVPNPSESKKAQ